MRNRSFQSRMNLLALAAILLLALLPTFGRLAQAGQGDADGAWTQMCTMAGLKVVKLPFAPTQPDAPVPDDGKMGADCAYCPLLGTLTAAIVALVLGLLAFAPVALPLQHGAPVRAWLHPSGLGSRGPPSNSVIAL
ncbi:DUF2946 family protein [Thermomonas sp. HDW16]|uniref:DUF2946 family protein n=1 Tax=Thermomonas sp. HDW16 TaxID=2714945 RepID=UPI00140CE647|nr:DUF2946 family protein [Thermomonas sp. HDW16]QIL20741.1 DUF2946 family protein [Thermomonas sp. HDW16]